MSGGLISENITIVLPNVQPSQQSCWRNMHIHECMPLHSGAPTTQMDSPQGKRPVPKLL